MFCSHACRDGLLRDITSSFSLMVTDALHSFRFEHLQNVLPVLFVDTKLYRNPSRQKIVLLLRNILFISIFQITEIVVKRPHKLFDVNHILFVFDIQRISGLYTIYYRGRMFLLSKEVLLLYIVQCLNLNFIINYLNYIQDEFGTKVFQSFSSKTYT